MFRHLGLFSDPIDPLFKKKLSLTEPLLAEYNKKEKARLEKEAWFVKKLNSVITEIKTHSSHIGSLSGQSLFLIHHFSTLHSLKLLSNLYKELSMLIKILESHSKKHSIDFTIVEKSHQAIIELKNHLIQCHKQVISQKGNLDHLKISFETYEQILISPIRTIEHFLNANKILSQEKPDSSVKLNRRS
jgi:hypothetical protein